MQKKFYSEKVSELKTYDKATTITDKVERDMMKLTKRVFMTQCCPFCKIDINLVPLMFLYIVIL